jgi:hypothetical protein
MIPTDTSTYTDEDILDILNEEMDVGLLTTLMTLNEEHLVINEEINYVAGTTRYKIPHRAVGNKLRDVAYITQDGVYELTRISLEELSDYRSGNYSGRNSFYVEGDEIVLVGTSIQASKLRMYYYLTPNSIVKEVDCGKITSINRTTGEILVETFPNAIFQKSSYDFVQTRNPNRILKLEMSPVSQDKNLKQFIFAVDDIPSTLIVGDYICEAESSPYPNIPKELHPILAQRAALFFLEAQGDNENLGSAKVKLMQMETSVQSLLISRVEGAPKKIAPRHTALSQVTRSALKRFS